ncbi:flavin reductase family protein [Porticoccaceae bacterium LTM1]|nr:flavin reductase family protein [Porticoccaceae bacterium LTM1]
MKVIDHKREFRNALGTFATGVTVVTSASDTGEPIGMTVNSFASVSLDPPLVLWSIDKRSRYLETFTKTDHFAIHILKREQEALSNLFASSENDKFTNLQWQPDSNGTPLLPDYETRFVCTTEHCYEGGDHIIIVGKVRDFDYHGGSPLLFHCGRYKSVAED